MTSIVSVKKLELKQGEDPSQIQTILSVPDEAVGAAPDGASLKGSLVSVFGLNFVAISQSTEPADFDSTVQELNGDPEEGTKWVPVPAEMFPGPSGTEVEAFVVPHGEVPVLFVPVSV